MNQIKPFDWSKTKFRSLNEFKKQFAYYYAVFTGEKFMHFTVCRCLKLILLWFNDKYKCKTTGFENFYYKTLPCYEYCYRKFEKGVK